MSLAVAAHANAPSEGRPEGNPRGGIFTSQLDVRYKEAGDYAAALLVVEAKGCWAGWEEVLGAGAGVAGG